MIVLDIPRVFLVDVVAKAQHESSIEPHGGRVQKQRSGLPKVASR